MTYWPDAAFGWLQTTLAALLLTATMVCNAEVVRIDINEERSITGESLGLPGNFSLLRGVATFALDPAAPLNDRLVDIGNARVAGDGRVHFEADLVLLRPGPRRSNGVLLLDIPADGQQTALTTFNRTDTAGAEPPPLTHPGDGFLQEAGYTVVWLGWQHDLQSLPGSLRLRAPAVEDVPPGPVAYTFVPRAHVPEFPLERALGEGRVYPPANTDDANYLLALVTGNGREAIPRVRWQFARFNVDERVPDARWLTLDTGFLAKTRYEVVYQTNVAELSGAGYAAYRDLVTHLRRRPDLAPGVRQVIAYGHAAGGQFLRGFIHDGFNTSLDGTRVLDGVIIHDAGGVRRLVNRRYARPSHPKHAGEFPFASNLTDNPVFDVKDAWGHQALADGTMPRTFLVNGSNEYWRDGQSTALVHVDPTGESDLLGTEPVRIYAIAGRGRRSTAATGQAFEASPLEHRWILRALLTRMERWIAGDPPPASVVPQIASQTLVEPTRVKLPFMSPPAAPQGATERDRGPGANKGINDRLPGARLFDYPVLVPAIDRDGNERGTLQLPQSAVPLGTHLPFNRVRRDSGVIDVDTGGFQRFPRTAKERLTREDPRRSVAERYPSRHHYLGLFTEAALKLTNQGFLLPRDLPQVIERGLIHWDHVHRN